MPMMAMVIFSQAMVQICHMNHLKLKTWMPTMAMIAGMGVGVGMFELFLNAWSVWSVTRITPNAD